MLKGVKSGAMHRKTGRYHKKWRAWKALRDFRPETGR